MVVSSATQDISQVLPSSAWLSTLADWVEEGGDTAGADIARDIRAHAARLAPNTNPDLAVLPSARWASRLATWLWEDPRPGSTELARQVKRWAEQLAATEGRTGRRVIRL